MMQYRPMVISQPNQPSTRVSNTISIGLSTNNPTQFILNQKFTVNLRNFKNSHTRTTPSAFRL